MIAQMNITEAMDTLKGIAKDRGEDLFRTCIYMYNNRLDFDTQEVEALDIFMPYPGHFYTGSM